MTGKKLDQKIYYSHSDYVGGMKETTLREMMNKKPEKVIELAVKGMLPKGPLGRQMIKKLHVYAGAEHGHEEEKNLSPEYTWYQELVRSQSIKETSTSTSDWRL